MAVAPPGESAGGRWETPPLLEDEDSRGEVESPPLSEEDEEGCRAEGEAAKMIGLITCDSRAPIPSYVMVRG